MKDRENDKRWSDKYLPIIKRELGDFLMRGPKQVEDALRNTDLIILGFDSVRIERATRGDDDGQELYP